MFETLKYLNNFSCVASAAVLVLGVIGVLWLIGYVFVARLT
jgi:hypothetical protein